MPIPTPDTEPLELTTLAQGDDGPREAVSTVLRDHAAFAEFFDGEPPTEHPVDWDAEVVTVVALGPRGPGSSVTIEEIQFHNLGIRGGTADVYFREVAGDAVEDSVPRDALNDEGRLSASVDEVDETDAHDDALDQGAPSTPADEVEVDTSSHHEILDQGAPSTPADEVEVDTDSHHEILDQGAPSTPADQADGDRVTFPFHAVRSAVFGHAFFHPVGAADVPAALFRDWRGPLHTDDGVGVYVPREEAPLSRSVAGFSVDRSGSFVAVHDAPGDGPVEVPGHWRPAPDGLTVELEDGRAFTIQVVSVDEHELRAGVEKSAADRD